VAFPVVTHLDGTISDVSRNHRSLPGLASDRPPPLAAGPGDETGIRLVTRFAGIMVFQLVS